LREGRCWKDCSQWSWKTVIRQNVEVVSTAVFATRGRVSRVTSEQENLRRCWSWRLQLNDLSVRREPDCRLRETFWGRRFSRIWGVKMVNNPARECALTTAAEVKKMIKYRARRSLLALLCAMGVPPLTRGFDKIEYGGEWLWN